MKKLLILLLFLSLVQWGNAQVRVQGTLPVPTDITYATLKSAFDAINAGIHKGSIVVSLGTADNQVITETLTSVLNKSGSGSASYSGITIMPVFSNITIYGSINGTGALDIKGMILLNGAQNVTIDGRLGGAGVPSLTIENSSNGDYCSTVSFVGASSNTIRYCSLKSSTRSSLNGCGTLSFFNNGTTGSSNNTIEYCVLTKSGANLPKTALASSGASVGKNVNNVVRYCSISDFSRFGLWLGNSNSSSSGYNEGWVIDNNTFFETSTITLSSTEFSNYAISIGYHDGGASTVKNNESGTFTITNNTIGGNGAGGNWSVSSTTGNSSLVVGGIYFGASTTAFSNISGNSIKDFNIVSWVNTNTTISGFNGIYIYHSKVKVGTSGGNTICNITLDHKSTWGGVVSGITLKNNANYNCEIRNNQVYNINALSGTSYFQYFYGIYDWAESSVFDDVVINNRITNINVNLNSICYGIHASGTISQNHVSNINVANGTSDLIGIYFFGVTTANRPNLRVENNEVILGLDNNGISTATGRTIYGIIINGIGYAYYNSILIRGTHSGSTNTCCLRLSTATGTGFMVADNLLYNERTGGSGVHYCIMTNSNNPITSNNNAYLIGAGANNLLGRWNTADQANLAAWAAIAAESYSISETTLNKPVSAIFPYLSTSGNLNVNDPWLCAGVGTATLIDFINSSRSGSNPTSIGAYEQSCTPLPVELVMFEARCVNTGAELSWMTYSELNNHFFTIEQSVDLVKWTVKGVVTGAGNSNSILTYSYVDEYSNIGTVYYRLKQTDFDGGFSYSKIVAVTNCDDVVTNEFELFPNPVNDELVIRVNDQDFDLLELRISDATGRILIEKSCVPSEDHCIRIYLSQEISPGIYFLQINNQKEIQSFRFLKR